MPLFASDAPAFNAPLENRTGVEWLSRDDAELDESVADPACGWAAEPSRNTGGLFRAAERPEGVEATGQRYRDAGSEVSR